MAIYKSALSYTAYPMGDPKKWLKGENDGVDDVVQGRLAAYAEHVNKIMQVNTGVRPDAFQLVLYNAAQAWIKNRTPNKWGVKSAAKPGESYHSDQVRLAVDVDDSHPAYHATNAELAKFGLCKPIESEPWHIQPIETAKLGTKANTAAVRKLCRVNLSEKIKYKYQLSSETTAYLDSYEYAFVLYEGLLAGKRDFSEDTINYIMKYQYGKELIKRLGVV